MPEIEIFTNTFCPFCLQAKRLLTSKGVEWKEIDLYEQPERRGEMLERAGGRHTVPQVFVNGEGLGGYDDIAALDRAGKLDGLLGLDG